MGLRVNIRIYKIILAKRVEIMKIQKSFLNITTRTRYSSSNKNFRSLKKSELAPSESRHFSLYLKKKTQIIIKNRSSLKNKLKSQRTVDQSSLE